MDLEKQKRNQLIRVVVTEILMVLAIIPIVMLLTLMAMGYHIGEDLSLEQSGLVQISSLPNGASVWVDGEDKFKTDASRMLPGGKHELKLTKEGYDSWSKQIEVVPGILLRLRYPRLFKLERKAEAVSEMTDLQAISVAPSRTRLLARAGDATKWQLINIRNDEVKFSEIDLRDLLSADSKIIRLCWSWNSDAALVLTDSGDGQEWILVDMRENISNRNLSKDFGLKIEEAQFAGDNTDRIFVLENGNLREIRLDSNGISKVLLDGVEEIYASRSDVLGYVRKGADQREIGIYHNGEAGGVVAQTIADEAVAHVAVSEYYGEKYLSYTVDNQLSVYRGENFPVYGNSFKKMQLVMKIEMPAVANAPLIVSRTGEAILATNNQNITAIDVETGNYNMYEAISGTVRFVDDYLLNGVKDAELYVWDFDGLNQRRLARQVANFPAVITANNRWLYYIANVDENLTLVRERL